MNPIPVGVDIGKNVFQIHYIAPGSGEIINKPLKRANFLEYFANLEPCLIGMEACGGSQHWARSLSKLGHKVRLMAPRFAKAFNIGNKNDAADARAIWLAVQQPGNKVAVKSEAQQAVLALHRLRQQLVKFRTSQINCIRGLLGEYGEVMPASRRAFDANIAAVLDRVSQHVAAPLIDTLREQWSALTHLDEQIARIEQRLKQWMSTDSSAQAISAIPGVGLLTATAAVATIGDASAYKSGREFAASIGLVPRQVGSGGRTTLLGISKRGDAYLRTLLVHCARVISVQLRSKHPWIEQLLKRRPYNVAIVALANKLARVIWAVLARGRPYQQDFVSTKPA
ncbi:IS110 family transposase [Burkholderia gladioli]|uniref:IS110 family transposase n=1 Tax=Burkholderia gladioli TaxID=28095 RepID=UPI00163FB587|nr:IS110 family transposase [Burkholderia gladioli]MBU9426429.1 IS110 family transposase [Burkholderia gladioli]MDN8063508.1 IS110 family transposase [Burkholderia gladioli]